MNGKRALALFLCLALSAGLPALAEQQPIIIQPEGVINRQILKSSAQTLDYMPEAARARTDAIVIGVPDLTGETNPFFVSATGDHYGASLMFDELLFTNNNGDIGPGVAEGQMTEDPYSHTGTITFTLKDKVSYADGAQVTSDDFINALYLLLLPGYDGAYDITRAGILGAEAYLAGEAPDISGITRVDDRVFTVTIAHANPDNMLYFAIPALRASLFGDMRRPQGLDAAGADAFYAEALQTVREARAEEMAYGQYFLASLSAGEEGVFTANPSYFRGAPYVGEIRLKVLPVGDELSYILDGTVDMVSLMGSVETVDQAFDYETAFVNIFTWEGDVLGYLGMDLDNPLFQDTNARHALAIGFDREQARRATVERYGRVPGMLLFDSFGENSNDLLGEQYPYDAAAAARLLEAAGWSVGEDGILVRDGESFRFTFTYNTPNPIVDRIVSQMQADYLILGIDMQPNPVSFEALEALMEAREYDMYFRARRLPASPALAADLFVGESHLNQEAFTTDRLTRLLSWSAMETDPQRQAILYENLFQELYVELPFIPLYRRSEMLLVNARVMNVTITSAHDITSDAYRFFLVDTLEGQW